MSAQTKQQPKHKQPGSKPTVSWSREKAEALRLAAKQRKPSACDCNCACK